MTDTHTHELIDKLHRRLSAGVCKARGCNVYLGHCGPAITRPECVQCDAPEELPKGVDE